MNHLVIYHKYEYLAKEYSYKVFNLHNIGLERCDVEQELKMKLFLSLQTYFKKMQDYKTTGRLKPIPLKFYLKTVMINKVRDIINSVNKVTYCSIEDINLNYQSNLGLQFAKAEITINGQELTSIFDGKQKKIMKLYIASNFEIEKVYKFGKSKTEVTNLVKDGLDKIKVYLKH